MSVMMVCLTHVDVPVLLPPEARLVGMGSYAGPCFTRLSEDHPQLHALHPALGGLAGSFAARRMLEQSDASHICIFQYRKFICPITIGKPSETYAAMNVLDTRMIGGRLPAAFLVGDDPDTFPKVADMLIGGIAFLQNSISYFRQYDGFHFGDDLLDAAIAAVELGHFEEAELEPFLRETEFLPGGCEVGVYPRDFWIDTMRKIEQIVMRCRSIRQPQRSGYQSRYFAFCAERLSSYMLLRHIRAGSSRVATGKLITLVNDLQDDYDIAR